MTRPVLACIDLAALQHNLNQVKKLAPESRVMAIAKANAYGHGLLLCSQVLEQADAIGLLDLSEAISLRKAGISQPICLLEGFFSADEIPQIINNNLEPVIHSPWQLDALEKINDEADLSVWLKVDTGMNRLGFSAAEFKDILARLSAMKCIGSISVMSHLANADEPESLNSTRQIQAFLEIKEAISLTRSLANSAAIFALPECHLDWVRPGIMLYGSSPFADSSSESLNLRPVMSLKSEIISIKNIKEGDAVGYGGSWICPQDMKIGVVACGYGDGYPRHAATGTPVMVAGKLTKLVGRVSMDMITVDLRGVDDAEAGSPVELWGREVSVDTVAKMSGTIAYQLLCGVTARVKRQEATNG
jgi:alanine racemase